MHEYTISKIKIFGNDSKKWQAHVLTLIDKDQIPVYYGGTMVDENGDPKCSLIVSNFYIIGRVHYVYNIVLRIKHKRG